MVVQGQLVQPPVCFNDLETCEELIFSPIGQEYPFLLVSEIFLSRPAISAKTLKAVSICQSLLNIAQPCAFYPLCYLPCKFHAEYEIDTQ